MVPVRVTQARKHGSSDLMLIMLIKFKTLDGWARPRVPRAGRARASRARPERVVEALRVQADQHPERGLRQPAVEHMRGRFVHSWRSCFPFVSSSPTFSLVLVLALLVRVLLLLLLLELLVLELLMAYERLELSNPLRQLALLFARLCVARLARLA